MRTTPFCLLISPKRRSNAALKTRVTLIKCALTNNLQRAAIDWKSSPEQDRTFNILCLQPLSQTGRNLATPVNSKIMTAFSKEPETTHFYIFASANCSSPDGIFLNRLPDAPSSSATLTWVRWTLPTPQDSVTTPLQITRNSMNRANLSTLTRFIVSFGTDLSSGIDNNIQQAHKSVRKEFALIKK